MRAKIFSMCVLLAGCYTTAGSACEYRDHNITIDFGHTPVVDSACSGVIAAIKFFEDAGYDDRFTVNITVADEVFTYMKNENSGADIPIQIFGRYNGETNQIDMSAFGTEYMNTRTAWNTVADDPNSGMEITEEIWTSVITHETSHALATAVYNRLNPVMVSNGYYISNGASEFIAYMIQLSTTREKLRNEIIESFDNPEGFTSIWSLNPIVHYTHPHRFGVQSYNTNNSMEWFHNALHGKIQTDLPNI
jgi:hypothetical protein|tara:strand:- start:857 stop:1603 length:747 start_codon:yes stop_codon:yes gene_type:complete